MATVHVVTRRSTEVEYDGTNAQQVADLLTTAIPELPWSVVSEVDGVLTLHIDMDGTSDMVLNVGDHVISGPGQAENLPDELFERFYHVLGDA